jgi:hypothetical protein
MDEKINEMDILELVDRCMNEINKFRRGEASNDVYGLELFRRALQECDPFAWEIIQLHFTEMMLQWMRSHPLRNVARNYDSDENYVAQGFTRFWQATIRNKQIHFKSLAAILRYLRASLNGVIIDTLRAYSRPREISLPETGGPGEPVIEDGDDDYKVWEVIRSLLPDERQQRVAYLIYRCGLKPREIIQFCSPEFSDIQEIYRLRRSIFERLQRNADYIRWRLDYQLQ